MVSTPDGFFENPLSLALLGFRYSEDSSGSVYIKGLVTAEQME